VERRWDLSKRRADPVAMRQHDACSRLTWLDEREPWAKRGTSFATGLSSVNDQNLMSPMVFALIALATSTLGCGVVVCGLISAAAGRSPTPTGAWAAQPIGPQLRPRCCGEDFDNEYFGKATAKLLGIKTELPRSAPPHEPEHYTSGGSSGEKWEDDPELVARLIAEARSRESNEKGVLSNPESRSAPTRSSPDSYPSTAWTPSPIDRRMTTERMEAISRRP
jgi:hypothetical protein